MSKPDWKDAPEWANYLAQDECGEWWWFEGRPEQTDDCTWDYGGKALSSVGQNLDWHETLERRP